MNETINGVAINGKFYEVVPKGSRHCNDCDLYERCDVCFFDLCANFAENVYDDKRCIFKYSQEFTDKMNGK